MPKLELNHDDKMCYFVKLTLVTNLRLRCTEYLVPFLNPEEHLLCGLTMTGHAVMGIPYQKRLYI